ncbi:choline-phosphate cytidylyltransferase A [Pelomyxa schiedti]|nr:choline-phosphate cytidylyltransferase A [Pelomyxa schiedti]
MSQMAQEEQQPEKATPPPTSVVTTTTTTTTTVVNNDVSESEPVETTPDPTMALSVEKVAAAKADTSGRVYRVYCDGIFDLFHIGHMLMLKQAKFSLGDPQKIHLIAGVCSDELTVKNKGKTVFDWKTRCASVENCKWVDEVAPDAPWVLTDEFIEKYKIDFVAHDALPYITAGIGDVYAHIKERGMFLETKRTEGISTSDIILQIVRDYDSYVERNLARGYTPEQLHVGKSWLAMREEHTRREKLMTALRDTRTELKEFEDAAVKFARRFAGARRRVWAAAVAAGERPPLKGNSGSFAFARTAKGVATGAAKEMAVAAGEAGVWRAFVDFMRALFHAFMLMLSYFNLAAYLPKKWVLVILTVVVFIIALILLL